MVEVPASHEFEYFQCWGCEVNGVSIPQLTEQQASLTLHIIVHQLEMYLAGKQAAATKAKAQGPHTFGRDPANPYFRFGIFPGEAGQPRGGL